MMNLFSLGIFTYTCERQDTNYIMNVLRKSNKYESVNVLKQ
jgi:hypothetical protein